MISSGNRNPLYSESGRQSRSALLADNSTIRQPDNAKIWEQRPKWRPHHGCSPAAGPAGTSAQIERVLDVLNSGMLAPMISIGHRSGLFDAMAALPPASSERIAQVAGLDERYVRELLAAMTTGRIVDHDPAAMTFTLPPAHAAWLTRAAGPDNLAVQAQYVGLLAEVEDDILGCFRDGGGVGYAAFPRFQALMAEDSGAVHDATLIEVTLPLVAGLVERLRAGIDVADVGCGSGHAVNLMGAAFPASRFVGFDTSDTGPGRRDRRGPPPGPDQCPLRPQGCRHPRRNRTVRPHHDLRRGPRPGPPGPGAHRHRAVAAARRGLPVRGHHRVQHVGRQPRPPARAVPVHHLLHALHDRLPRRRRHGPGHHVGDKLRGGCSPRPGSPRWTTKHVDGDILNTYYIATRSEHVSGTSTVRTRASAQAIAADSGLRCTDRLPTAGAIVNTCGSRSFMRPPR